MRYNNIMSGSQPFMYLLLPSMYQQIEWHILPLIHLSIINNIPISLSSSNFTFASFFLNLVILILVKKEKQDQVYTCQCIYFEHFHLDQLAIIYCSERTNRDIHISFYFKFFPDFNLYNDTDL